VGPNYDIGILGLNNILTIGSTCGNNVRVSLSISHIGILEGSGSGLDVLKVYYTIGSSPEVTWLNIAGSQYNTQNQIDLNTNGAMLSLRIEGKTTHSSEVYSIRNVQVVALASAPTSTPTCAVPWSSPDLTIGVIGLTNTQVIDTTCKNGQNIAISLEIGHTGSLEATGTSKDYLQVKYQIDSQLEVLWLDIAGQLYNKTNQISVVAGSQLKLTVVGDTTVSTESYVVANYKVV
jgi:hypothetical protein